MGKRLGDRKDGCRERNIPSLNYIMPMIYRNRSDNEAFISERIDLTNVAEYLKKKNADSPEYAYNLFQVLVTAVLKAITLRPKMNRFITNQTMYMRNEVTAAFVVKKIFSDDSGEALAFLHSKESDTIDTVHQEIYKQVSFCRGDTADGATGAMDILQKLPHFLVKLICAFFRFLDRHGWMPNALVGNDPNYASVLLTNLGSIKLHSGYHHLSNWGTCSVFCVVGEAKNRPFYDAEGNIEMRYSIDIGLTVDERIADGYYFSGTIRLLRKLLENPELLELPLGQEVEY